MSRRKSDDAFTVLWNLFMLTPWWVCPMTAAIVYIVLASALPWLLSRSPVLDSLGVLSRALALPTTAAILIIGLVAWISRLAGSRLLDGQTGVDTMTNITWQDFERLIAAAYRRQGYSVSETGGGADDGIDLILHRDGERVLVQCKHWHSFKVGVQLIRELHGVTHSNGNLGSRAIFVTFGEYTNEASAFARDNGIELVDGKALWPMVRASQRACTEQIIPEVTDEPSVACPLCGNPMVIRTARRGSRAGSKFWGCSRYPACRSTRECADMAA